MHLQSAVRWSNSRAQRSPIAAMASEQVKKVRFPQCFPTHPGGCRMSSSSCAPAAAAASFPPTQSAPPLSLGDCLCRLLSPAQPLSEVRNPGYKRD